MDDIYQYTASAVNDNEKEQSLNNAGAHQQEENDVVLKAFNNINWGKKWTSLLDTVKKQSEAFVEGTKKDLQEFAQVLTEDASDDDEGQQKSTNQDDAAEGSDSQMRRDTTAGDEGNHNESALLDNLKDSLGKINTVNFNSLRDGLVGALKNPSSQLLKQVKLPENMDLNQLKEGLNDRTRSAEQYLQRFGTEVLSNLKNTVTILAPEEESPEPEQEEGGGVENGPRIYATRREALIAKMQTNENTYLKEPEITREDEKKVYETFKSTFNINEYTGEIAQLLEGCPKLREMMNTLVPVEVSYSLFWQRYFYHAWKIDQDEQKRQLIVQQHQEEDEDEEDFKWDSDDEEEEKEDVSKSDNKNESSNEEKDDDKTAINDVKKDESSAKEQPIRVSTSSHSEDTDDFSHISADEPNKTEDEWVKAEEKKSDKEEVEEDSDSDWE